MELIKLNGIEFKGKEITIQDATSTRPRINVPFKNSKRLEVVVTTRSTTRKNNKLW